MWKDFRAFVARGNVLDLAVGVIIGAAFATIAKSLTDDLIMPVVGWLFGGLDFSSYFVLLGPVPANYHGALTDYAALKAAGVAMIGFGQFISVVINFLILAFMVFLLIRWLSRLLPREETLVVVEPAEVELLREIRDELRRRAV